MNISFYIFRYSSPFILNTFNTGEVLVILELCCVSGPPKITQAPRHKKVAEEGTVSFICKASGDPAPSFHWERVGKKINDRRNRYEINDAPHISVLRIKPVKANKDNATFTCVANNGLGEARADASLTIYPKVEGGDGKTTCFY